MKNDGIKSIIMNIIIGLNPINNCHEQKSEISICELNLNLYSFPMEIV